MIPADHITFNDDGTAWLCVEPDRRRGGISGRWYPRPCDTCGGEHSRMASSTAGGHYADGRYHKHFGIGGQMLTQVTCPDCIDGRHTFTIDVKCEVVDSWTTTRLDNTQVKHYPGWLYERSRSLRVSIVPNHVIAIVPYDSPCEDNRHIVIDPQGIARLHDGLVRSHVIDLPPEARPGGYAVKLKVAP